MKTKRTTLRLTLLATATAVAGIAFALPALADPGVADAEGFDVPTPAPAPPVSAPPAEAPEPALAEVPEPVAEPPAEVAGPVDLMGPVAGRFNPIDVAAAPPPSGLRAPAPPAFARTPCDTFGCGGNGGVLPGPAGRGLGVVESPVRPGTLPGLP